MQQSINPPAEWHDEPIQYAVLDAGMRPIGDALSSFDDAWLVYQTHEEADKVEVFA